eukprot:TRINITY_DN23_c2_g1_i1.p1 TRINITY_DN23_c2_g1~~TRINITY_DN23_c2_g1_i1.p1  ORF type:complete len:255 (+),score=87.96 TRINITY_DN23_c2_g1_i1:92-766(+)
MLEQGRMKDKTMVSFLKTVESYYPVCFDIEGRGNYCPSLQSLWSQVSKELEEGTFKLMTKRYPAFMIDCQVSPRIIGGADLMAPGIIISDLIDYGEIEEGQLRCIVGLQNPYPFAIGRVKSVKIGPGTRGKALEVLHCWRDELCELSTIKPPPGFLNDKVISIVKKSEDDENVEEKEEEKEAEAETEDKKSDECIADKSEADKLIAGMEEMNLSEKKEGDFFVI